MESFVYRRGQLYVEDIALPSVAARYGTPCYVYSRKTIEENWTKYDRAFSAQPHLICYAVKANSNLAVIDLLARLGSGFDVVSLGELERVLSARGDPSKLVFAGVAKREDEMRRALAVGIRSFNVESQPELERLNTVAGSVGRRAPVSLRVNPDVDANTHPYISTGLKTNKFGIDISAALSVYRAAVSMPHIEIVGVGYHIGSQILETGPLVDAVSRVLALAGELESAGIGIRQVDVGGGLGIRYRDESPPEPEQLARAILPLLAGRNYQVVLEPGRSIVGNAGVLLTRVEYIKHTKEKSFAIVDAAMNDLFRPALYDAWHEIVPTEQHASRVVGTYDVVGPVCETSDFLGKGRSLAVQAGDLLAVCSAGAYGSAMSSTYNSRPSAAEVMVDGDAMYAIRKRGSVQDLMGSESILPD
jgi:diaminopimelate decarboxylase